MGTASVRHRPQTRRLPFLMQFHSYSKQVFRDIKKHWPLLKRSYPQIEVFQQTPFKAFRRNKTMRDALVRSEYRPRENISKMTFLGKKRKGCFPCLSCIQCKLLLKGDQYVHPENGDKVAIKGFFTCQSSYVIYILTCPCKLLYVGETTQKIKDRIAQHRSTIRLKQPGLPVSRHFLEKGHQDSDLRFMVLEEDRRGGDRILRLKQREVWWINRLRSLYPDGMNRDYDLYLFL